MYNLVNLNFQHFSGLDEAVLRNIDACKEMAKTTRSNYGPNGEYKQSSDRCYKLNQAGLSNYCNTQEKKTLKKCLHITICIVMTVPYSNLKSVTCIQTVKVETY